MCVWAFYAGRRKKKDRARAPEKMLARSGKKPPVPGHLKKTTRSNFKGGNKSGGGDAISVVELGEKVRAPSFTSSAYRVIQIAFGIRRPRKGKRGTVKSFRNSEEKWKPQHRKKKKKHSY